MTYIDLGILLVILIYSIIGFKKGLLSSIAGFISFLGALTAAYFLGNQVKLLLEGFGIHTNIQSFLENEVFINNSIFQTTLTNDNFVESVQGGLIAIGLPNEVASPLIMFVDSLNQPLGNALAQGLTNLSMIIFSFIGVYLLVRIVLQIIMSVLVRLVKRSKVTSNLDSLLGFFFGLTKGFVFVFIVIAMMTALSFINGGVNEFLVSQLKLSTDDQTIGKIVYFWVIRLLEFFIQS
jgi:uncharacterized membrane protein required for colicin V production